MVEERIVDDAPLERRERVQFRLLARTVDLRRQRARLLGEGGLPAVPVSLRIQHQAHVVIEGMHVYPERMRENLDMTRGALFSQAVLTALIEAGLGRDEAYRIVQRNAQRAWDDRRSFRALLEEEPEVASRIDSAALGELFDYRRFLRHLPTVFERLDELEAKAELEVADV
jgi:hypothetical protein